MCFIPLCNFFSPGIFSCTAGYSSYGGNACRCACRCLRMKFTFIFVGRYQTFPVAGQFFKTAVLIFFFKFFRWFYGYFMCMDGGIDGHSGFNSLSARTQTPKHKTCYIITLDFITFCSRKKILHVVCFHIVTALHFVLYS
jgi:hypothetical protein